jgi:hypothetical protein
VNLALRCSAMDKYASCTAAARSCGSWQICWPNVAMSLWRDAAVEAGRILHIGNELLIFRRHRGLDG